MRLLRIPFNGGVPPGGFVVEQGGTVGLEGVWETMKLENQGIPILNSGGTVRPQDIPPRFLGYQATLEGVKTGYRFQPFTFQITNFGFNRVYQLEMENGTITRDHDEITVVPEEAGEQKFYVNEREFTIYVEDAEIVPPSIPSIYLETTPNIRLYTRTSPFKLLNVVDTHLSTEWEVYSDAALTTLIASTTVSSGDLLSASFLFVGAQPVFYVRARHVGATIGPSRWSDVIRFRTAIEAVGSNNNDALGHDADVSDLGEKVIVGIPGTDTVNEANRGAALILRNTGNNYTTEQTFVPTNQPSSVELTIPAGGEIRITVDSTPPYDNIFTSSQTVNLPAWASQAKFFGKGGPGSQVWVPPVPGTPQQGLPEYPSGLPPYSRSYQTLTEIQGMTQYYSHEGKFFRLTPVIPRYIYWSDYTVGINYDYGDVQIRVEEVTSMSPIGNSLLRTIKTVDLRLSIKIVVQDASYSQSRTMQSHVTSGGAPTVTLSPAETQTANPVTLTWNIGETNRGYTATGNQLYPSGLPPYVAPTPEQPGYYQPVYGEISRAVVNGVTHTFDGGYGGTPAVTQEKSFFANAEDSFGTSVTISGNYLAAAIGAPKDKYQTLVDAGSVFYSRFVSNAWTALSRLNPPVPASGARFGEHIAMDRTGNTIFVGAPGQNRVYVFRNYIYVGEISSPSGQGSAAFGSRVACNNDGTMVAITAPNEVDGANTGKVRVFQEVGGNWQQTHDLFPRTDYLSLGGSMIGDAEFTLQQLGADDVLISSHALNTVWSLHASAVTIRLVGKGTTDGQDQLITYMGVTYAFKGVTVGSPPEQTYDIPVVRSIEGYATSLDMSEDGTHVVVGAPYSRLQQVNQGFASVFELITPVREQKFTGRITTGSFRYGMGVDLNIDGTAIVCSEPYRNSGQGSFDTHRKVNGVYQRVTSRPPAAVNTNAFGTRARLSADGQTTVMTDPAFSSNRGKVYIF